MKVFRVLFFMINGCLGDGRSFNELESEERSIGWVRNESLVSTSDEGFNVGVDVIAHVLYELVALLHVYDRDNVWSAYHFSYIALSIRGFSILFCCWYELSA